MAGDIVIAHGAAQQRGRDLGDARPRSKMPNSAAWQHDSTAQGVSWVRPRNLCLALHHAPADHRSVAVAITTGHRVLEHLVHQLGAARIDAILPGKLPRIGEILDGIAY